MRDGSENEKAIYAGSTIDVHSHAGVLMKSYVRREYPYAETVESLYHKQLSGNVDVNVVFPLSPETSCDIDRFVRTGVMIPAGEPLSPFPYMIENEMLLKEVYEFCPEISSRFLPFVCVDPGRMMGEQVDFLEELLAQHRFYGIKVNPVSCQSKVIDLLKAPRLFEFAAKHNLPFLFHVSSIEHETFSYTGDALRVVEEHPENRFCLAHCLLFHKGFLDMADELTHVWVDTAALKIQCRMVAEQWPGLPSGSDLFCSDYTDHTAVLAALVSEYPDTMLWGTDSPAYSYMVDRMNGDGSVTSFRLKGLYSDEVDALRSLDEALIEKISCANTLDFLFGR